MHSCEKGFELVNEEQRRIPCWFWEDSEADFGNPMRYQAQSPC